MWAQRSPRQQEVTHGRMDGKITEHELEDMVELIGATIGDQLFREFHVDAEVLRSASQVS